MRQATTPRVNRRAGSPATRTYTMALQRPTVRSATPMRSKPCMILHPTRRGMHSATAMCLNTSNRCRPRHTVRTKQLCKQPDSRPAPPQTAPSTIPHTKTARSFESPGTSMRGSPPRSARCWRSRCSARRRPSKVIRRRKPAPACKQNLRRGNKPRIRPPT